MAEEKEDGFKTAKVGWGKYQEDDANIIDLDKKEDLKDDDKKEDLKDDDKKEDLKDDDKKEDLKDDDKKDDLKDDDKKDDLKDDDKKDDPYNELFDEDEEEENKKDDLKDDDKKDDKKEDPKEDPKPFSLEIDEKVYDADGASEAIKRLSAIEKDEFLTNFIKHYDNGGDPNDYIRAHSSTTEGVSTIDLARYAHDHEHADLDKEMRDILWNDKVQKVFKQGLPIDEDGVDGPTQSEANVGKAKMQMEAKKAEKLIKVNKDNFKIAKKEVLVTEDMIQKQIEANNLKAAEANKKDQGKWFKIVDDSAVSKKAIKDNKIGIKFGDKNLSYKVKNGQELVDSTKDFKKFLGFIADADGNVDPGKLTKLAAIAQDIARYESTLINYGAKNSKVDRLKDRKNIKKNDDGSTVIDPKTQEQEDDANIKAAKWTTLKR